MSSRQSGALSPGIQAIKSTTKDRLESKAEIQTEAVKKSTDAGIGLEEVVDFSDHKDVKTLLIYRDRERNVQGTLSKMIAGG